MTTTFARFRSKPKSVLLTKLIVYLFVWPAGLLHAQADPLDVQQPPTDSSEQVEALDVVESAVQDLGFFLSLHDEVAGNPEPIQQLRENFYPLFFQRAIARLVLRSRFDDASRAQREYLGCLVGLAFFNAHLDIVAPDAGGEKNLQIIGVLPLPDYSGIFNVDVSVRQADEVIQIKYRLINRAGNRSFRIFDILNGSDSMLAHLRENLRTVQVAADNKNADAYKSVTKYLIRYNNGKLIAAKHWCEAAKEEQSKSPGESNGRKDNDRFEIKTTINGQPHNVFVEVEPDGKVIYQDDIILGDDLSSGVRALDFRKLRLWSGAVVPYIIDESISDEDGTRKAKVLSAIEEWDDKTPVSFVEAGSDDKNILVFTAGMGCRSYLGMQGGLQSIILGSRCSYGAVLHEIGHALGLIHEHNRDDRDDYININLRNVLYEKEHNFYRHPPGFPVSDGYCYSSIMHYPEHAFSISRELKTIEVKGRYPIGQRKRLSSCDVSRVSKLYAPLVKDRLSDSVLQKDSSN